MASAAAPRDARLALGRRGAVVVTTARPGRDVRSVEEPRARCRRSDAPRAARGLIAVAARTLAVGPARLAVGLERRALLRCRVAVGRGQTVSIEGAGIRRLLGDAHRAAAARGVRAYARGPGAGLAGRRRRGAVSVVCAVEALGTPAAGTGSGVGGGNRAARAARARRCALARPRARVAELAMHVVADRGRSGAQAGLTIDASAVRTEALTARRTGSAQANRSSKDAVAGAGRRADRPIRARDERRTHGVQACAGGRFVVEDLRVVEQELHLCRQRWLERRAAAGDVGRDPRGSATRADALAVDTSVVRGEAGRGHIVGCRARPASVAAATAVELHERREGAEERQRAQTGGHEGSFARLGSGVNRAWERDAGGPNPEALLPTA
jgi:hypothetical protein